MGAMYLTVKGYVMKEEASEKEIIGPKPQYPNFHWAMLIVFLFTTGYAIFALWLLFDGYINSFLSLNSLWSIDASSEIPKVFQLALFSLVGSILGCATLDIVSFHKYIAIKKVFDLDHIWGFFFSPILAAIIGLIVFALFQSGLLVFSGNFSNEESPVTAELGFTAVGFVAGYSWHDVITRFREISDGLFKKEVKGANRKSSALMKHEIPSQQESCDLGENSHQPRTVSEQENKE